MKLQIFILFLLLFTSTMGFASPKSDFNDVYIRAEMFPEYQMQAEQLAISAGLPLRIYTSDFKFIEAKGIEDGQVVYTVIVDRYRIFDNAYTAFFSEVESAFDFSSSRVDYGNGTVIDNTNGLYTPALSPLQTNGLWLLIPEWNGDQVYAFNAQTGDLIDPNFIPTTNPVLQSPKHALQAPWGNILVSDQISDAVQEFDTSGVFLKTYAPAGGPNPSILDNIRGIYIKPDSKLLVTVASGASQNTIQQFDTGGVHIGTFISGNLNSPFDIMRRNADYLISNSTAPNDITQFDLNGTFLSNFIVSANLAFPQQMFRLENGNIVIAGFSSPSGLVFFDSAGTYLNTFTAVTGNRGVYRLGNGNYLTTNSTGVHEIDDTTGVLIRTISTASNFQYISEYNPTGVTNTGNKYNIIPDEYELYNNYPNPFNPSTSIKFAIPTGSFVSLKVYDVIGREVSSLVNEFRNSGEYTVKFDASGFGSGVYFYKLQTEFFTATKKMLLIK